MTFTSLPALIEKIDNFTLPHIEHSDSIKQKLYCSYCAKAIKELKDIINPHKTSIEMRHKELASELMLFLDSYWHSINGTIFVHTVTHELELTKL